MFLLESSFSFLLFLAVHRWATAVLPAGHVFSPALGILIGCYFVAYFLLMWITLYSRHYHYYLEGFGITIRNAALPAAAAVAAYFIFGMSRFHPFTLVLTYLVMGAAGFILAHGAQILWTRHLSNLGYFTKKVLVIGDVANSRGGRFQDICKTKSYAGEVVPRDGHWEWKPVRAGAPRQVRGFQGIKEIILKESIGEIVLFKHSMPRELMQDTMRYCQEVGLSYYLVLDGRVEPERNRRGRMLFPYAPLVERYAGPRDSLTQISIKRIIDIAISSLGLIFLAPLGAIVALAIKLDDGGPALYVSTRIGRNGRPIRFYKFRSMRVNAEKEKTALLRFNARSDGPLFKMKDDPRVTRVGRLLRRYSIDEIPQLLNVFVGTMSLVGPRPHLPQEVSAYELGDSLRLECMPGIVGLPQVTGSATMSFRDSVRQDLIYRRHWSLRLDFSIIVRTIKLVLIDQPRWKAPADY